MYLSNPYLRALLGGLAAAIVVASPIVDDGVARSEALSILGAFLAGSGLTAVAPSGAAPSEGKHRAEETYL